MKEPESCVVDTCEEPALSGEQYCFPHLEDQDQFQQHAVRTITSKADMTHLVLNGLRLQDHSLRERQMVGTRLGGALLKRVVFERCHLSLVFLHDAVLSHCHFVGCYMSTLILAGSKINDCLFEDCDMPRCNFVSASISRTNFVSCDLTSSRFIGGTLRQVTIDDCNLYHTHFELTDVDDLVTHGSNLTEAYQS